MILYAIKLRAVAIIGVLLIHISARLVRQEVGSFEWWIGNLVDSSSRWAVPLFIMLSGMLLLGKKESQWDIITNRIPRLFLALLFWSFIYSLWAFRYDIGSYSFTEFAINLYQNDIKYHLWYLYAILGLYLVMPLFKTFIQQGKKTDILYFLFLSFAISAISTTLSYLFKFQLANGFEYFLGYGGYFILGYYLANTEVSRKTTNLFHLLGIAGLLLTILGTWLVSAQEGSLNQVFYEYLSITTPFVSISLFLFMKDFGNKPNSNLTSMIAKYSFGIYLTHPMVLDVFRGKEFIQLTGISHLTTHPIVYTAFMLIIVLFISLLLTLIISRIPVLRKFV
ncbi:acyltransferase family protein [Mesobacillus maritimus]|uniref:acyltransferase n=1 Tax=Mesobacillus maritimus TaxID=1643336 RepID=UPI00203D865E|nr:acyltransferase family protein [Mesobacillus maritimus]MCM3585190.1 acyltransferase family protein [Mesobacillus maritimus]